MPRRWQWLRRAVNVATVAVLALWSLLLAAWLTLHWVILPHIDEWRPDIERWVSRTLGLELRVGAIRVRSGGWVPALELQDLRLYDSGGREALHLERVQTALAPQSLLSGSLRFEQILIDGARLEVRRDALGGWHVAGLHWAGSFDGGDTRARDWVLRQHEIVIRNAEVHWTDDRHGMAPVVLDDLDFVLRNGLRGHALRLDATPPPEWGQRFTLRGRFRQPLLAAAGDLHRWSGTLFAEFPQANAAALRRHLTLPFELAEGDGALRAWVDISDGTPRKATLDFALRAVSLQLAPSLRPLQMQQLQGRADAERDASGIRLQIHDLSFVTGDGLGWPAGDLMLSWRQAQDLNERWTTDTPVTGGEATAARLDLQTLSNIAERAPFGQPLRNLLAALAPRGAVQDLKGSWTGPLDRPQTYQVDAKLHDLTLQPAAPPATDEPHDSPGRPGVRQAQIDISASERGGQARLAIRDGALVFPGLWEQPEMAVRELDAALSWRIQPAAGQADAIEVRLAKASFANADFEGEVDATWHSGAGTGFGRGARYPGRLDLTARLKHLRADSIARYLPLGIAEGARHHVRDAVRGGSVPAASFRVKGDLWDFPFHSAREGEMRIVLQLQDVGYAYMPAPWPAVEQLSGELEFNRLAMRLGRMQGRLWGYELRDVQGGMADLSMDHPVLTLRGRGRGPAADLLRFARLAPPGPRVGAALESVVANGPTELELAARIPLAPDEPNTVQGSVLLAGVDLRLNADLPPLLGTRGSIDIAPQGLAVRTLQTRWLGGETTVDGSMAADGSMRFGAQGLATAEALRQVPAVARLGLPLQGQAAWRGSASLAEGLGEVQLQSNLVGMQIALPPPLSKAAAASLPLRLQLSPLADATLPAGRRRDSLQLELGDLLSAQFQRELSATGTRVLRGSLAVRDSLPPLPPSGVQAALNLGRVDLDAWQSALARGGAAGDGAAYLPQRIRLRAEELRAGARYLSQVQATIVDGGSATQTLWRAQVESAQLAGEIEYRAPQGQPQDALLKARLQRLSVPQSEVAVVESLFDKPPASVPALDIVADEFDLRGRKLGRLQVTAVNRRLPGTAAANEWQLDRLELVSPEAQLQASGRWAATGARRMSMDFKLGLNDSGAFAERLGAGQALRGGKGQLSGQLSWAGSPLTLDYPSLDGQLRLDVGAGQFLNADPGTARLLGVLSLQALPRRLSLDFRDLFQQGFAFDHIDGDVKVSGGVARTDNLRMRGVQATVLMQGSADLQRETQDLSVWVVPNFDASGAALATMVINPAIGLGALFAQWALREPLIAANTSEWQITGSWADPDVRRIERAADAPPPGAPAPPRHNDAVPTPRSPG